MGHYKLTINCVKFTSNSLFSIFKNQFFKHHFFRYKSLKEREAYHKAMKVLLPMFLERIYRISDDASDLSVLTQKQILKIFFTFIQVFEFF